MLNKELETNIDRFIHMTNIRKREENRWKLIATTISLDMFKSITIEQFSVKTSAA